MSSPTSRCLCAVDRDRSKDGLLALLSAVFALFALAGLTPALKGQTGRIVFQHARDGSDPWSTEDIYSVNADGSSLKALTTDGRSHDPTWYPNGRHILYIHDPRDPRNDASNELYQMDSDGANAHLLRRLDGSIDAAELSPDGKTSAVTYTPSAAIAKPSAPGEPIFGLFSIPMEAQGEPRSLFPVAIDPAWSPDGRKLAFSVRVTGTGYAIGVGDADGSNQIQLTDPSRYNVYPYIPDAAWPAWSPDGKQIAYDAYIIFMNAPGAKGVSSQRAVFLMAADGSGKRRLTTDPDWRCGPPSWSPDGKEIAFYCSPASTPCSGGGLGPLLETKPTCVRRIFVMSLTDPNAKPIQITRVDGANPVFAPPT
jgi:Tol biopolymer transport system component